MAATINSAVSSMETFGDSRTRDIYHRNAYQSVKALTSTSKLSIGNTFYGITAATGSAHTASTAFELAKITAVEDVADGYSASLQLNVNSGTDNLAGVTVAKLAKTGVDFAADHISSTFATNFSSTCAVGLGRDGVEAATVTTYSAGATGPTYLRATPGKLYADATAFQVNQLTVRKDLLSWVQEGGTALYKLSAANDQYVYTHGTGANSTGVRKFNLDGFNVDGTVMTGGGFSLNSFDNAGAAVEVMKIDAANTGAAGQNVSFTNSNVGIGSVGSSAYKFEVGGTTHLNGNTSVTGDISVSGNLSVNGTVTTVNSTEINVKDRNITLASGATSVGDLNTGGINLGTDPAYMVNFMYNDAALIKAWESNVNYNALSSSYFINGGDANAAGAVFSSTKIGFYDPLSALSIGSGNVLLNKTGLSFSDDTATIKFGSTIFGKNGFTATGSSAAVILGPWRLNVVDYGAAGGKTLNFSYDTVGSGVAGDYVTKFSISPQ